MKKSESNNTPRIVIDSREAVAVPKVVSGLRDLGVNVRVELLEAGDYYVLGKKPVLVERKYVTDLVGSVRTRRLWSELDAVKRAEAEPLLLIEGSLALIEKFTNWNPKSIVAVINNIILEWNVPVVTVPSQRWTVIYLASLAEDLSREKKARIYPLRVKEKAEKPEDYARMTVEGLPGISGQRAINLLRHFKTVRNIANASVDELAEVEGIGEKIAKRIYETFNLEWKEIREYEN